MMQKFRMRLGRYAAGLTQIISYVGRHVPWSHVRPANPSGCGQQPCRRAVVRQVWPHVTSTQLRSAVRTRAVRRRRVLGRRVTASKASLPTPASWPAARRPNAPTSPIGMTRPRPALGCGRRERRPDGRRRNVRGRARRPSRSRPAALQSVGVDRAVRFIWRRATGSPTGQLPRCTSNASRALAKALGENGIRLGSNTSARRRPGPRPLPLHYTLTETRELIAEIGEQQRRSLLDSFHWFTAGGPSTTCDTLTACRRGLRRPERRPGAAPATSSRTWSASCPPVPA